jgi:hypothetical protein
MVVGFGVGVGAGEGDGGRGRIRKGWMGVVEEGIRLSFLYLGRCRDSRDLPLDLKIYIGATIRPTNYSAHEAQPNSP